jgi:hypothetical protein
MTLRCAFSGYSHEEHAARPARPEFQRSVEPRLFGEGLEKSPCSFFVRHKPFQLAVVSRNFPSRELAAGFVGIGNANLPWLVERSINPPCSVGSNWIAVLVPQPPVHAELVALVLRPVVTALGPVDSQRLRSARSTVMSARRA